MTTTQKMSSTSKARAILLAVMLSLGLSASPALAAQRDGTTIFFSFEDLRESLRSPPQSFRHSLDSLFQLQPQKSDLARRMEGSWHQHQDMRLNSYTAPVLYPSLWGN